MLNISTDQTKFIDYFGADACLQDEAQAHAGAGPRSSIFSHVGILMIKD
jgi:hypothetical protein